MCGFPFDMGDQNPSRWRARQGKGVRERRSDRGKREGEKDDGDGEFFIHLEYLK